MAAAIEAMADMGFPKKLVRQKVNQLLKVGTFLYIFCSSHSVSESKLLLGCV